MKKGFTLIELLAVIVILAVLAFITVPVVNNILKSSKKETQEVSIKNYVRAVDSALIIYEMDNDKLPDGTYSIINNGNICIDTNCTKLIIVDIDGEKPSGGSVTIRNNKVDSISNLKYSKFIGNLNTAGEITINNIIEGPICYISKDIDSDGNTDIGDKITCGTESFYVVKNDNSSVYGLTEFSLNLDLWHDSINIPSSYDIPDIVKQEENGGGLSFIFFSQDALNAYETYLNSQGVSNVSVNLMSTEIAESFNCFEFCDSNYPWLSSMWYWIEGNDGNNSKQNCIRYGRVASMTIYGWYCGGQCEPDGFLNVRPVVTISLSNFN